LSDWKPQDYLTFADARLRPARDLLTQVPLQSARLVYDLGCGPGNSTALLVQRFPGADVVGIDSSPAMREAARKACPQARYEDGDLTCWLPDDRPDLVFSNAAFQWVFGHLDVLERLAERLPAQGVLAVQMPDNLAEPSHALMQEVAMQGPWSQTLAGSAAARQELPAVSGYYARLKPHFSRLDIWHTIYNHPLQGVDGIVAWFSTTGLRPYLDPLMAGERRDFIARYREKLAQAYPALPDGTVLLRFPRLFILGVRA